MEQGRGKVTEGMGGTRQDMGCGGKEGKKEGMEREERGYNPQTSIPGAVTADLNRRFVNLGSALRSVTTSPLHHILRYKNET